MGGRADHSPVGKTPRVLADYTLPVFWDQTEDGVGGTGDAGHGGIRRGNGGGGGDCGRIRRDGANTDVTSASLTTSEAVSVGPTRAR
jgi:hypothetical protein